MLDLRDLQYGLFVSTIRWLKENTAVYIKEFNGCYSIGTSTYNCSYGAVATSTQLIELAFNWASEEDAQKILDKYF